METSVAVRIEEGGEEGNGNNPTSTERTTNNRIRSLFHQIFSRSSSSNRLINRTSRSNTTAFRRHPRPQPINVQRTLEMAVIHMPFHVHRDSFVYKKKKKGPSNLHFIFDSNIAAESPKTLKIGLYYKNEQIDSVEAESNRLKQNLTFKNLSNDPSSIGKSLQVIVEDGNGLKQVTQLELIQSINGFIVARIYSQQVFGKYPDGSPISHYLQDIYCQPFSISLQNQQSQQMFPNVPPNPVGEEDDEDDKNSEINRECIICLSEKRDTIVLPCRHMCLCAECADLLSNRADRCPICREGCQALLQVNEVQNSDPPSESV
jgi:hypothetical protein